jgi:hypothetical protein
MEELILIVKIKVIDFWDVAPCSLTDSNILEEPAVSIFREDRRTRSEAEGDQWEHYFFCTAYSSSTLERGGSFLWNAGASLLNYTASYPRKHLLKMLS